MEAKNIIKEAQAKAGQFPTGYKGDVNIDNLPFILEKLWTRAKNLTYTFGEFRLEVVTVIGTRAYTFFLVNILDFIQEKMNKGQYSKFHEQRYCA